ncbi:15366_t:CDS:2 [Cetraspora pellucida]|uniref:15366_t:CDS:1 n=1 Tax=Cetraspora pellucida TaxID=1433469 RepID=A0ACA9K4Z0_9GLOM|nr:15366_t:CDS:2 [Cetraspora pellucida]
MKITLRHFPIGLIRINLDEHTVTAKDDLPKVRTGMLDKVCPN